MNLEVGLLHRECKTEWNVYGPLTAQMRTDYYGLFCSLNSPSLDVVLLRNSKQFQ